MSTSTEWKLPAGPVLGVPTPDELKFLDRLGYKQSQIQAWRWIKQDMDDNPYFGEWVEWVEQHGVWQVRKFRPDVTGMRCGQVPYFKSPQLTALLVFIELEKGNGV